MVIRSQPLKMDILYIYIYNIYIIHTYIYIYMLDIILDLQYMMWDDVG